MTDISLPAALRRAIDEFSVFITPNEDWLLRFLDQFQLRDARIAIPQNLVGSVQEHQDLITLTATWPNGQRRSIAFHWATHDGQVLSVSHPGETFFVEFRPDAQLIANWLYDRWGNSEDPVADVQWHLFQYSSFFCCGEPDPLDYDMIASVPLANRLLDNQMTINEPWTFRGYRDYLWAALTLNEHRARGAKINTPFASKPLVCAQTDISQLHQSTFRVDDGYPTQTVSQNTTHAPPNNLQQHYRPIVLSWRNEHRS